MKIKKYFVIDETACKYIYKLLKDKIDMQYIRLNTGNGFSDIVQYSEKYQSCRVITVRNDKLNTDNELRMRSH